MCIRDSYTRARATTQLDNAQTTPDRGGVTCARSQLSFPTFSDPRSPCFSLLFPLTPRSPRSAHFSLITFHSLLLTPRSFLLVHSLTNHSTFSAPRSAPFLIPQFRAPPSSPHSHHSAFSAIPCSPPALHSSFSAFPLPAPRSRLLTARSARSPALPAFTLSEFSSLPAHSPPLSPAFPLLVPRDPPSSLRFLRAVPHAPSSPHSHHYSLLAPRSHRSSFSRVPHSPLPSLRVPLVPRSPHSGFPSFRALRTLCFPAPRSSFP